MKTFNQSNFASREKSHGVERKHNFEIVSPVKILVPQLCCLFYIRSEMTVSLYFEGDTKRAADNRCLEQLECLRFFCPSAGILS